MRPDADQALRAHDDVTHTPTIFVRQLHAIHLAIGPVGRRRITGVSPTDCAETHAPLLPPAERSTITADCPTTPTVSIAASHKPMIAVVQWARLGMSPMPVETPRAGRGEAASGVRSKVVPISAATTTITGINLPTSSAFSRSVVGRAATNPNDVS